ncbi:MAG TPA: hypothetical protein VEC36_12760 [Patescibacteria group bacterium]|nr:hypothetical protein [Patescibacteria group bacterium]
MLVVVQLGNNAHLQIQDGVAHCDYKIVERITNRMLEEQQPIAPDDEMMVANKIAHALGGKIVFPPIGRDLPPGSY